MVTTKDLEHHDDKDRAEKERIEKERVIKDEAEAERRYQEEQDKRKGKGKDREKDEPKDEADRKREQEEQGKSGERVRRFNLTPLAEDAPEPPGTPYIQASALDPETKKVLEALIVEIRTDVAGGGGGEGGGDATAELKATVKDDLNNLRDSLILTLTSLDADAGVATDTFVAQNTPPPITTV